MMAFCYHSGAYIVLSLFSKAIQVWSYYFAKYSVFNQ